ncbi:MAG TPA: Maf family protein [Pseudogracilibacillus sp.]|nr:Maf family protein [Pseudogracilibacillus sp.]
MTRPVRTVRIQRLGVTLVKEIHGDYFNVIGLPIARVVKKDHRLS